jgi:hypothetical protein
MNKTLSKKGTLVLTYLILILGLAITKPAQAANPQFGTQAASTALIYMSPSTIVGTTIGQTFSAFMMIKDFTDMYLWQVGITFNPAVVKCNSFDGGSTLADDVFDVLAPTNMTMFIGGTIDNTLGKVSYSSQGLSGSVPGVTGTPGVGYKLLKFNFEVIGVGVSDVHIIQTFTLNHAGTKMKLNLLDVFTVVYPPSGGALYPIYILTNSTGTSNPVCGISQHAFIQADMALNFTVTISNTVSPKGFCNVTIPKTLMSCSALSDWVVTINGASPLSFPTPTGNSTHTFVYFEYNQPSTSPYTRKVQIKSTSVVPEFPTAIILPLLMIITLIAVALGKLQWSKKRRDRIIAQIKSNSAF